MDDKIKAGSPDSQFINVNEEYELPYRTKELNISKEKLIKVVKAAGTSATAVKAYFNK